MRRFDIQEANPDSRFCGCTVNIAPDITKRQAANSRLTYLSISSFISNAMR